MRILIVPGYYGFGGNSAYGKSGSGSPMHGQALALARNGFEVYLSYCHFDASSGVKLDVSVEDKVTRIIVHAAPLRIKANLLYKWILQAWSVRKVLRSNPPDVIHAHVFLALPQALIIGRVFNVPVVYTEHSSGVLRGRLKFGWRTTLKIGSRRCAAIIAVSGRLANSLKEYVKQDVKVVENIVSADFFDLELAPQNQIRPFTFLSVGRVGAAKGWDILLAATRQLIKEGLPIQVVLAGERDRAAVFELVDRFDLREVVCVRGRVANAQMPKLMREADCHVSASRYETFGMVSIESLAVGRPVIVTRTGAAEQIVSPKNGLVVPVEDIDALALAMRKMVQQRDTYDPEELRRDCREKYSEGSLAATLGRIYENAARVYDGRNTQAEPFR